MSGAAVLCLVEHDEDGVPEASLRALTIAREFAESGSWPLEAVLVGDLVESARVSLADYGVGLAHVVEIEHVDSYAPLAWAHALEQLTRARSAHALLAAGSDRGNEVLAHLGAITARPFAANCLSVRSSGTTISLSRQRWAGSLFEDAELDATGLAILSVAFDGVIASPASTPAALEASTLLVSLADDRFGACVKSWAKRQGGVDLAGARVVVGGGRGVGSAENFASLDELAELLGAAVGVSRVVTSNGWRSHAQQVGQTGTRIAPELYLATGISGATQHLAGCQSAKVVIAINTDADAPIITRADYAVIGDLNKVVPALVEAIRARD